MRTGDAPHRRHGGRRTKDTKSLLIGANDAVAAWAKEHGRELDGPPLEINLVDGDSFRIGVA